MVEIKNKNKKLYWPKKITLNIAFAENLVIFVKISVMKSRYHTPLGGTSTITPFIW